MQEKLSRQIFGISIPDENIETDLRGLGFTVNAGDCGVKVHSIKRYQREHSFGNFGVYFGNEQSGQVRRLAKGQDK